MLKFQRATIEDAEEIVKVKIDAFSEEIKLYGLGPDGYDDVEHYKRNRNKAIKRT